MSSRGLGKNPWASLQNGGFASEETLERWHTARYSSHRHRARADGGGEARTGPPGFRLFNHATYAGDLDAERRPHGSGLYELEDEEYRYKGDFVRGQEQGHGHLTVGGATVEGQFEGGEASKCSVKLPSGHTYTGLLREGQWVGPCRVQYAGGALYEGELKNGVPHGAGKHHDQTGNVYQGEFKNGRMDGKGRMVLASGDVLEGWFKDGLMSGEGVRTTAGGNVFNGMWVGGKLSGIGRMECISGVQYEGEFTESLMHGSGVMMCGPETAADGEELSGFKYDGSMDRGFPQGAGTLQIGQMVYKGEFRRGKPHGPGSVGEVQHGKREGVVRPTATTRYHMGIRSDVFEDWPGKDAD